MRIDLEEKTLSISVRELAYFHTTTADSNFISSRLRTKLGQLTHKHYQQQVGTKGSKEQYINFTIKLDSWNVQIKGFCDVVYDTGEWLIIEEIKSVIQPLSKYELNQSHEQQLQLYAHYFNKIEKRQNIEGYLVLIDPQYNEMKIKLHLVDQTEFLQNRLQTIITTAEQQEVLKQVRKKRAKSIKFPYDHFRTYQEEIITKISQELKSGSRYLLSAPPGIGKTLASLLPLLKYTIENDMRLFITTSKTTQQEMYRKTIQDILAIGDFNAIILSAKRKICHTDTHNCEQSICPYLDRYLEMDPQFIIQDILEHPLIDHKIIEEYASSHEICPFELSLDVSMSCDVIIGDYNYVFDPMVTLQRYFFNDYSDSLIIVDEAHNLPNRANEYYTEEISASEVQHIVNFINKSDLPTSLQIKGRELLLQFKRHIISLRDQISDLEHTDTCEVEFDIAKLTSIQENFDNFTIEYINHQISSNFLKADEKLPKDTLIYFSDKLKWFSSLVIESTEKEFSQIFNVDHSSMKVLCKSSAKKLASRFSGFHAVVVQSATITPFEYFLNILGLPQSTMKLEYPSPFPKENQLYLINPSISTQYNLRENYIGDIAQFIKNTISVKPGNYLVFFPSFTYLQKVNEELENYNLHTLVQESNMGDKARKRYLRILKEEKQPTILMAVMGGIFSEGVDYPDGMAIGSIIIGPGLPAYSYEQELKKQYFDLEFGQGFDYAYRNPGIAKVIQSVGRIFRKETDKGVIILLGVRFAQDYYLQSLPQYWDIKISQDPLDIIMKFWSD
ncbi:MAG: ATP-dependent DNA helicase [Candidatus Heimdallarchaeota archaeon]|nr:ATP-dependent DNA helicase [Candidatus Heimdallarchaeota archaeon]